MYDTVSVPLDHTDVSRNAVSTGVLLGRMWTAPVQLVTVISPGIDRMGAVVELSAIAADLDVPVRPPLVLEANDVAAALAAYLRRQPSSLLCLATHGRGVLASTVLGSTALDVVATVDAPVVLVGPHSVPSAEVHDICVAVQPGSPLSASAVDPAMVWARAAGARLHFVSVVGERDAVLHDRDAVGEEIATFARRCRDAGVQACSRLVDDDDVVRGLLAVVSELGSSMTVLATHGRGPLARLTLGSVAQQVVRRAGCPTLAVPVHAADTAAA